MRVIAGSFVLLVIVGCTGEDRSEGRPGRYATAESTSVDQKGSAQSQFARFLSLSIATRDKNRVYADSVYTDGDIRVGGDVAPCLAGDETVNLWLADYHVLSVNTRGDTAIGTAAITTAVREVQELDGQTFVATPQIQEDTARWRLVNGAVTGGKWMVCGPGSIGKELFGLSKVGKTIKWPHGGSPQTVMATIDSIRRARSLSIAR